MNAGRMLFALARHFNWWQQRMVTEFEIDGLREDLVIVSRAGYATVVEIKVSRGDWMKTKEKSRWTNASRHVARFFYAIPRALWKQGLPPHVPPHVGVLVVRDGGHWNGYDTVAEERAAHRLKAERLPAEKLRALDEVFYYRFWRLQMDVLNRRFHEKKAA